MRYLFAILVLSAAAVRAINPPEHGDEVAGDEVAGNSVARDQALFSSGPFKYVGKDHPQPDVDGEHGVIVGTGKIGKSVFTSAAAFVVANPDLRDPKSVNYAIIRESHVTAQGLQAVADAGTIAPDGKTLGAGHVSIMIPEGQRMTVKEIGDKMDNLQGAAVRGKVPIADQIGDKANADPTRPLAEIKEEVNPTKKQKQPKQPKQPTQPRKPKKSDDDKSGGGAAESSTAGGSGTTNCKRDGSFCTLGNRPKKTMATGKNAASTVTKKTAGNPKSRKAATHAVIAASKKSTTRSKTRLASSKVKAIAGKKPVKGTGKPTRSKKDKKASSKQSRGSKKGANTKAAAAGRGSRTKKAGARGKGASSTKATTTKLRKPSTGKKGSATKKAVTMAARVAKSTTKRIHRREVTMNRPRMVYEAAQGYKRGLTQESMLNELD